MLSNKKQFINFWNENKCNFSLKNGKYIQKNVSVGHIKKYLQDYKGENRTYPIDDVILFLNRESTSENLKIWNIAIKSLNKGVEYLEINDDKIFLREVEYSVKAGYRRYHLKGVLSPQDTIIDLDIASTSSVSKNFEIRNAHTRKPLMIITPITPKIY